ncbi:MAG: hypothetical protein ACFCBU_13935 [Cyanophyceae cyanobacterium]
MVNPLSKTYLNDGTGGLWIGGDWCGGHNVEGALASGLAIAEAVDKTHGNSGISPKLADLVTPVSPVAAPY